MNGISKPRKLNDYHMYDGDCAEVGLLIKEALKADVWQCIQLTNRRMGNIIRGGRTLSSYLDI